ncbi:multidrug resistance efflux pump membrane fusion protein [Escherichia coli]|nr:multidrug resistance efflux pump membrane fusion protein [Escherichia coli]
MEQINSNKKHSNRRKYFSLLAVVLFIAFSGAYAYWSMELEDMISTDDAYVTGNADPISAQVSGGNDSNLLIVFYVQIMPDNFVMQLHRF